MLVRILDWSGIGGACFHNGWVKFCHLESGAVANKKSENHRWCCMVRIYMFSFLNTDKKENNEQ